jgi:uncharacterized protein YceH (UPF0502 family)
VTDWEAKVIGRIEPPERVARQPVGWGRVTELEKEVTELKARLDALEAGVDREHKPSFDSGSAEG